MNKSRESVIIKTSAVGLAVNIVIAAVKIVVGIISSSIAIVSDGIHSGADAATSILTVVGVKLSEKKPTEKHPFGFGRIEYLTSLVIAVLILVTGFEIAASAVGQIFNPAELEISVLALVLVAATAVVKFALGVYTIKKGKSADSGSLVGMGVEFRNDSFASVITIASSVIFLVSGVSLDAFAGILTAMFILKAGAQIMLSALSDILGKAGDKALAETLYREIRQTDGILNAADMMLHNYGPDRYSASVNIEIDHRKTIGEVYENIHGLQLKIMQEYRVTMVFGIYAVDEQSEDSKLMRARIAEFVNSNDKIKSYHALYHDKVSDRIYCDFIVGYGNFSWEQIENDFKQYMGKFYPESDIRLTVETEFV